jgi:hypothetical protein
MRIRFLVKRRKSVTMETVALAGRPGSWTGLPGQTDIVPVNRHDNAASDQFMEAG